MKKIIDWFIPVHKINNRTDHELAWIFVFTHLFGPVLAQPMWIYLYYTTGTLTVPLTVLIAATWSFTLLPYMLRLTGRIKLVTMLSFQLLAMISLFAAYFYGGFNSPFIPWLIVSLLLGLFYQSREYVTVLCLFTVDVLIFILIELYTDDPAPVSLDQLAILGWLSTVSATIYVTWMALYYSRIVGMKSEFEAEAERSREASIELEQARATAEELGLQRSRFFAKMSHELRTPLNAIIGYSEIMLEELEDQEDAPAESRKADVSRINAAGKHLLSLVSQVLNFSEIEKGAVTFDVDRFSLRSICDEVSATAIPNISKSGSRFIATCPTTDYFLETDATKLRQILINLLSNAAKFTKNGVVKLELSILRHQDEEILKASVRDTGIGISAEGLTRIFGDYEQAELETMANYGGTGIGLSISQRFAQLLGGEITVRSIVGCGSCFTLWIPTRYQPPKTAGSLENDRYVQPDIQGFAA